MDELDVRIVEELRRNAREPTARIAERLGVPRVTVHDRIARLERAGVLEGYTARVNYAKLGLPLTAYILATYLPTEDQNQKELARRIADIPRIEEVHILTGQWDFLLKVRAKSMDDIGSMIVHRLRTLPGIGGTITCVSFWSFHGEGTEEKETETG